MRDDTRLPDRNLLRVLREVVAQHVDDGLRAEAAVAAGDEALAAGARRRQRAHVQLRQVADVDPRPLAGIDLVFLSEEVFGDNARGGVEGVNGLVLQQRQ